jgi:hypothetical protein
MCYRHIKQVYILYCNFINKKPLTAFYRLRKIYVEKRFYKFKKGQGYNAGTGQFEKSDTDKDKNRRDPLFLAKMIRLIISDHTLLKNLAENYSCLHRC